MSKLAREASTFPDFRKAVSALGEMYNKRWLETEYNFAQAVGQNGAKYNRHIKEKDVFPYVKYRTIGDERVRDAHRALHDKIFEVGSDAYDLIIPPNGWGCRCELNQITHDDMLERRGALMDKEKTIDVLRSTPNGKGSEWDYMVRNNFNTNRAKLGEVFKEKEFYTDLPTSKITQKAAKAADETTIFKGAVWEKMNQDIDLKNFPIAPEFFEKTKSLSVRFDDKPGFFHIGTRQTGLVNIGVNDKRWAKSGYYKSKVTVHEVSHAWHTQKQIIDHYTVTKEFAQDFEELSDTFKLKYKNFSKAAKTTGERSRAYAEHLSEVQRKFDYADMGAILKKFNQAAGFEKYVIDDLNEMRGALADTLQGLTNSKIGWGHKKSYMKSFNGRYKEVFAHMSENLHLGNPLWEELFPESYKKSIELIKKYYP